MSSLPQSTSGAAVLAVVAWMLASCGASAVSSRREAPSAGAAPALARLPSRATAVPSVFDPVWSWQDEQGAPVQLSRWKGQTLLLTFVYTTCTETCSLTVERLRQVDAKLRRANSHAEFVLVTLDPFVDTSDKLHRFRSLRGIPAEWHLLRGSEAQTQDLLDMLGIKTINMGDHIVHDGAIAVVDPAGRVMGHLRRD
jgi:protein SCO1/2